MRPFRLAAAALGVVVALSCTLGAAYRADWLTPTDDTTPISISESPAPSRDTPVDSATPSDAATPSDSATPSNAATPSTDPASSDGATPTDQPTESDPPRLSTFSLRSDPYAGDTPAYVIALWIAPLNLDPKFPQALVDSAATDSADIHQLDAEMTHCNTTYQADLYDDDATTTALIGSGRLNGGDESWPGGTYQAAYSEVVTTPACAPPPPPVVDPIACIAAPGWTTEDLAPVQTAAGLTFAGGSGVVDTYQRVSAGNMQGLSGMSYQIAAGETGQPAQLVVEVDPDAVLNSGGSTVTYATISTNFPAGSSGTLDAQNSLWSSTKISSGPGSLSDPISWTAITALMPNNTLLSAPSLHLLSGSTSADRSTVTAVTSSCGSGSFVPKTVPCTAVGGWAAEAGDTPPTPTASGLRFSGASAPAVDAYQRVSAGNMQGITGMTYTIAAGTTGQPAQLVVEVDPNQALAANGPVIGYATISTNLPAGTSGVVDAQHLVGASAWSTTKIASGPGSLSDPISWDQMVDLMPFNTLLSAPSLHLLTHSTDTDSSTVNSVSSSCGTTSFLPTATTVVGSTSAPAAPVLFSLTTLATWSFTVTGEDLNNVHPGDHFSVSGTDLPPGSIVSGELHSQVVSLGSATVGSNGAFTLPIAVPMDFAPGAHELVMTLTAPGVDPIVSQAALTVVAGTSALTGSASAAQSGEATADGTTGGLNGLPGDDTLQSNILTHGLNSIADVLAHPAKIPAAIEIGLVLLIFAILPGHLLNATVAEQYERFRRRVPRRRRVPGWWSRLRAAMQRAPFLAGLALTTITALLFGFADPRFGFSLTSLRLFLGLAIALAIVTYLTNVVVGRIMRGRWRVDVEISLRPLGLILTLVGVVVSRLIDFSPGFLVGLVLGLVISEKQLAKHAWRAVLLRTGILLGLALIAWLAFSLFDSQQEGGSFASELAVETLVAVTTEATVALLVELLPLRLLEGERLFEKNKVVWGALYLVTVFIFVVAVVPWEGNWAALGTSLWAWLGVVVGFGIVATGVYVYFRVRTHDEVDHQVDRDESDDAMVPIGSEDD